MGCRPSRHASGKVADSSWGYNKDGYFQNDSKKRKRCKNGYTGQKPTEFSAFSSTSKTYQRTSRNVSQCSKITVRLSTDGSTLEIEKYDIDFHSNKATLCTKDSEWYSQGSSFEKMDIRAERQKGLARCESAPQLTIIPTTLDTISEHDETKKVRTRMFSNGYKHKNLCFGSKRTRLKHSKTFANDSITNGAIKTEPLPSPKTRILDAKTQNDVEDKRQTEIVIFDLESSEENSYLPTDKTNSPSQQTSFEKDIESGLISTPNSKSITQKEILIGKTTQNDCIGCKIANESSCCSHVNNKASADIQSGATEILHSDSISYCVTSSSLSSSNKASQDTDLRTEVYNSINKFNEIITKRQQHQFTTMETTNTGVKTSVSIHPTPCSEDSILLVKGVNDENSVKESSPKNSETQNNQNVIVNKSSEQLTAIKETVTMSSGLSGSPPTQLPDAADRTSLRTSVNSSDNFEHSESIFDIKNTKKCRQICSKSACSENISQNSITICQNKNECAKYKGASTDVNSNTSIPVELDNVINELEKAQTSKRENGKIVPIADPEIYSLVQVAPREQCSSDYIPQTIVLTVSSSNLGKKDDTSVSNGHKDVIAESTKEVENDDNISFYEENDDDDDEFFDENYDDYDEAEEYYDARHSLYV